MNKTIQIQDLQIPVERKRIKNLYLRLDKTGQIKVSAPYIMSEKQIIRFVESKIDWIRKKQNEAKNRVQVVETIKDGEYVSYFANKRKIKAVLDKKEFAEIINDEIVVHIKNQDRLEDVYKAFLKSSLQNYLEENVPAWEKKMNLFASSFYIREMKSRWGTCNTKTHRICFALNLAKKSYDFIDYVICHELAHIMVPNHGDKFKRILDIYYPNWRIIRKQRRE